MKHALSALVLPLAAAFLIPACTLVEGGSLSRDGYFQQHVKPVLQANCLRCHQGAASPAGLDLSNGESALAAVSPRTGRPFIIPGDPDCSLLISAVTRRGTHPRLMPRQELSLTEDEIAELSEWIEDGALWPKGAAGRLRPVFNPENP